MSDLSDEELGGIVEPPEPPEEVTPQSLDANLEGEPQAVVPESLDATRELPLMRASDLLDEEPLADIPVEPPDEETPPDPTPLTDKAWGPRGTPRRDERDARNHEAAEKAREEMATHPAIQKATEHEAVRLAQKRAIQEAFIKAQGKKK